MFRRTCCLLFALLLSLNSAEAADWRSLCVKDDLEAIHAILTEPVETVASDDVSPANAVLSGGNRPLHIAAEYATGENAQAIVDLLIKAGADVSARGLEGLTPLMISAAYNPNAAVTEVLLQASLNVSSDMLEQVNSEQFFVDANGRTPLHLAAAMSDNPDVLAALLRSNVMRDMIRIRDKEDRTALWLAASRSDEYMVALLLDAVSADVPTLSGKLDADSTVDPTAPVFLSYVDTPNREGSTPLHVACERPEARVIELLIKAGADVNRRDPHRYTPLMLAVSAGADIDVLRVLIDGGADLLAEDDQNRGALYLAATNTESGLALENAADIVTLLLDELAPKEVNTIDNSFMTPLMQACRSNNLPVARVLLDHGADVNMIDRNGLKALTFAALSNAPKELFELLLAHGASLDGANAMTRQGVTPLMAAVDSANVKPETVRVLLELGANPNHKTFQDISILMFALASNPATKPEQITRTIELVKILLDYGANPNLATWDGLTPLMIASRVINARDLFDVFLNAGANVNSQNNQGMTALMVAATSGNENAVEAFLAASVDLELKDIDGMTALCHVVQALGQSQARSEPDPNEQLKLQFQGQEQVQAQSKAKDAATQKILDRLISAGANVNVRMPRGMTPLMDTALRGQSQAFKSLLAAGADVSMRDFVGWTPLHFAVRSKSETECLSILLASKQLDMNTGDNGGTTPLMIAAACDNAPAVELLLKAGADTTLMDRTGRDALSYARMRNSRECIPILEAQRSVQSD